MKVKVDRTFEELCEKRRTSLCAISNVNTNQFQENFDLKVLLMLFFLLRKERNKKKWTEIIFHTNKTLTCLLVGLNDINSKKTEKFSMSVYICISTFSIFV